MATVHW